MCLLLPRLACHLRRRAALGAERGETAIPQSLQRVRAFRVVEAVESIAPFEAETAIPTAPSHAASDLQRLCARPWDSARVAAASDGRKDVVPSLGIGPKLGLVCIHVEASGPAFPSFEADSSRVRRHKTVHAPEGGRAPARLRRTNERALEGLTPTDVRIQPSSCRGLLDIPGRRIGSLKAVRRDAAGVGNPMPAVHAVEVARAAPLLRTVRKPGVGRAPRAAGNRSGGGRRDTPHTRSASSGLRWLTHALSPAATGCASTSVQSVATRISTSAVLLLSRDSEGQVRSRATKTASTVPAHPPVFPPTAVGHVLAGDAIDSFADTSLAGSRVAARRQHCTPDARSGRPGDLPPELHGPAPTSFTDFDARPHPSKAGIVASQFSPSRGTTRSAGTKSPS